MLRAEMEQNLEKMFRLRESLEGNLQRAVDHREVLTNSMLARMHARLESLPVIEQAKGVLMAQSGCTPEEAFQMLRRASQRTNVRVRDLAAEIVEGAAKRAKSGPGGAPRPQGQRSPKDARSA